MSETETARPRALASALTRTLATLPRRLVNRARRRLGWQPEHGLPSTAWARAEANPADPDPLASFRLFAVLGTWYEGDVIEATVRNALVQGCERVYLVDNDSPDDTVARAEAAGATLAHHFRTDSYDEAMRMKAMNDVVAEVSAATAEQDGDEHIWWLWLDADEFHHGPGGSTVREYLASLDRRFRVVGARFFNHYPSAAPAYVEGQHPLDHQPLCEEHVYPMCAEGHRKHPLQRWDRDAPPIISGAGFHQASSDDEPLLEPLTPIYLHHFPYRVEAVSRKRLELLCGAADGRAPSNHLSTFLLHKRFRSFDAVYAQRWNQVDDVGAVNGRQGVAPRPWPDMVPLADAPSARW